jgi:predicted RNase H-like HicB family nuclease
MINGHLDHTPRWRRATHAGTLQRSVGNSRRSDAAGAMHYNVVVQPAGTGGFRICFPNRPGVTLVAITARDIVTQAQKALALMLRHPAADLPRSIEDGARPPADLSDYDNPLVVVIPFKRAAAT